MPEQSKPLRVLLAGGGTAGHINPAIAIADTIKKYDPRAEILFIGTPKGMENRLVTQAGYTIVPVDVQGFQRKISVENIKRNASAAVKLMSAGRKANTIVKKFKPDLAIGTGGYVSGPAIRACQKAGVKTAIHEQNAWPGVTTKLLAPKADCVMLAVEEAEVRLKTEAPVEITGNPVRAEFFAYSKEEARQKLGVGDEPVILSYGGSLGARRINESMAEVIAQLLRSGRFRFVHAYGSYGSFMPGLLAEKGVDLDSSLLHLSEYIDNMALWMTAADLIVSRSGAITLSEIQVCGKASILIPSPNVAENHQYHNAKVLADKDAAVLIEEADLTGEGLTQTVSQLFEEKDRLLVLAENCKKTAVLNTNERIYAVLKKLIP